MIDMLMAVQQDLHVAESVSEVLDILGDQLGGGLGATVDQDVALGIGDQDRRDPARANQEGIAVDVHWRSGLRPVVPILTRRSKGRAGGFDRGRRRLLDLGWGL